MANGHLVEVKVWGRYACFTRPENKVERLSYPILTPSAAVGILESIYWKPQFRWQITEIAVLPHPDRGDAMEKYGELVDWENYMPITLNELAAQGDNHPPDGYNLEAHRVQRTCLILRWPCYRIRARAKIFTDTTNPASIKRQFDARVELGQCFHQPWLGLREFVAYFSDAAGSQPISSLSVSDGGLMMHSAALPAGTKTTQYRFVPLRLNAGTFIVEEPEVTL